MRNFIVRKVLPTLILLTTFMSSVYAQNVLSKVEINPTQDGYSVILNSSGASDVKKSINSENEIYLDIKGMQASSSVATIYNNVPDIESVVISSENKGTRITIQGKNVENTSVDFNIIKSTATMNPNVQELTLSNPVKSYVPVYSETDYLLENANDQTNSISNYISSAIIFGKKVCKKYPSIKNFIKNHKNDVSSEALTYIGVFVLTIVAGLKLLNRSSKTDVKIGLSQSLKERDSELYRSLKSNMTLNDYSKKSENIQNQYTPQINYGLKSYQSSQRNPYTTNVEKSQSHLSGLQPKSALRNASLSQNVPIKKPINPMPQMKYQSMPINKVSKVSLNASAQQTNSAYNVDSKKFIESMSKIYERSGRKDLAVGLQENLKKANLQQQKELV